MDNKINKPTFLVPHNTKKIAFSSLAFGPEDYEAVRLEILSKNFKVPTGDQTISLLRHVYCNNKVKDSPEINKIKKIIKKDQLWIFNINLWTNKGIYVIKDLSKIGENQFLEIDELEKKLKEGEEINKIRFSNDGTVRFAPKGSYRNGDHTPDALAKDGLVIASLGVKKAEELGRISTKFKNHPCILGIYELETKNPIQRVSAIGEWDEGLGFYGGVEIYKKAHAFGLLKQVA
jgi:hypothetical protein